MTLRGHGPRRGAEDARHALRARARRSARRRRPAARDRRVPAPARCRRSAETLPARLGRWLERSGPPRRLVERLRARPRRHDELAARLPAALHARRHEPLAPRHDALRDRERGDRGLARAHRRGRGDTRRSPSKSRAASASSRATATRTSAAGATTTTLMAAVEKRPARSSRRRPCASCARRHWPTSTATALKPRCAHTRSPDSHRKNEGARA